MKIFDIDKSIALELIIFYEQILCNIKDFNQSILIYYGDNAKYVEKICNDIANGTHYKKYLDHNIRFIDNSNYENVSGMHGNIFVVNGTVKNEIMQCKVVNFLQQLLPINIIDFSEFFTSEVTYE